MSASCGAAVRARVGHTTKLMELFRKARAEFALIVDEYGELQGWSR